jgi:hypothetical protein
MATLKKDRERELNVGILDTAVFLSASGSSWVPADQGPFGVRFDRKTEFGSGLSDWSVFLYASSPGGGQREWHTLGPLGFQPGWEYSGQREMSGGLGGDSYTIKALGSVGLGIPVSHVDPRLPLGLIFKESLRESQSGLGDQCGVKCDTGPTWPYGGVDSDGRVLSYGGLTDLFYYDATADPWASPTLDNFCGIGKDGLYYMNGQATLLGSFGTVAGGFNHRSWARCGGPSANDEKMGLWWYSGRSNVTIPSDGVVRCALTNGGGWESVPVRSYSRWVIAGDFDIQVDFSNYSPSSGPSDGGCWMEVYVDGENYTYCRRHVGGNFDKDVRIGGSWSSYSSAGPTGQSSGKFRITRVGGTISSYYWTGSAWAIIGSGKTGFPTGPIMVALSTGGTGGTYTYTVDYSNFIVNVGTVQYTSGWAREAAGTYRGSRVDFPDHALVACSRSYVDIIDADTNKLWMKFEKGGSAHPASSRALWPGEAFPRAAVMKDGLLMITYGNEVGGSDVGGCILVDFNLDIIAAVQDPAATAQVKAYVNYVSNQWWMNGLPNGLITARNTANGWYWDWGAIQSRGYRIYGADVANIDIYQYRAIAAIGGLTVHRWRRWFMDGGSSDDKAYYNPWSTYAVTSGPIWWCIFNRVTGELFYMDSTNLYSVALATYNATMTNAGTSTFVPDVTKALPEKPFGRLYPRFVRVVSSIYWPGPSGIWKISWPSGSWTLLYGSAESSALVKILKPGLIESITYKNIGASNYLVVAIADHNSKRWICVVDIDSQTLYDQWPVAGYGSLGIAA